MTLEIIKSVLIMVGSFLAHPLLYIGLLVLFLLAGRRVKIERESFHTRVYGIMADYIVPFWPAVIAGLLVSIITLAFGIVVTLPVLILFCAVYLLFVLTTQVRWMSPSYALGFAIIILAMGPLIQDAGSIADFYTEVSAVPLAYIAALLALLVIAEGFLIRRKGHLHTSPRIEKSKRGKWIGLHQAKRLWILPVVLLIPEGVVPTFDFWPVLSLGEMSVQPLILPFFIGYQQTIRTSLPHIRTQAMGMRVLLLGIVLLLTAVGSYFYPFLAVVVAVVAILGRELLWLLAELHDRGQHPYFSAQTEGCTVLGVLPNSPAEKMDIKIGETIVKVNGVKVNDETGFYHALQMNSAFCKLDVLNSDGEVRFAQGALYDGNHHQLGVLLVKTDVELQNSVV